MLASKQEWFLTKVDPFLGKLVNFPSILGAMSMVVGAVFVVRRFIWQNEGENAFGKKKIKITISVIFKINKILTFIITSFQLK